MGRRVEGYAGRREYLTRIIVEWIDNELDTLNRVYELGKECKGTTVFAEAIKKLVEDAMPESDSPLVSDILNSALEDVDWYRIAEGYL